MPAILALSIVLAAVLNFMARTRHVPQPPPARSPVFEKPALLAPSPRTVDSRNSDGRIFVGPDITPQFLLSLLSGHTEAQAEKLIGIYIGKWMKLSGEVGHVGKFEYGSSTVMLSGQLVPTVILNFSDVWTERLSVLRLGNRINVIGRIDKVDALMVRLKECELV